MTLKRQRLVAAGHQPAENVSIINMSAEGVPHIFDGQPL